MSLKQPTIKEIANRLNISVSTVSRALHDHHSIGLRTKMRVQQLAKELNYEPNQTAIFFQQRKTFTIGVILPELSEAFFSSAISGIEDAANKNKYTVLLGQSHDDEEREKQIAETMKNHRVDGLIISISKNTTNYDPNLIITSDLTKEGTYEAMRQLLSQRRKPTAIVAFNDYVALDAVEYAKNTRLKINKDITFVSYANLPISHYL